MDVAEETILSAAFFFSNRVYSVAMQAPLRPETMLLLLGATSYGFGHFKKAMSAYTETEELFARVFRFIEKTIRFVTVQYAAGLIEMSWSWQVGTVRSVTTPVSLILAGFLFLQLANPGK